MDRYTDRVAVITGGGSGIGRATALRVASEGARVVVVDMNLDSATAVADEVPGLAVQADVTDADDVARMFRTAHEQYGSIDVSFHNAGISPPDDDSILVTGIEAWDRVQKVNLTSVYLCCKEVIPYMQAQGKGSIINTASFVATMGAATSQISYTASKGGVLAMSRELGVQFAREGIRVNALSARDRSTPRCSSSSSPRTRSGRRAASCTSRSAASPSRRRSRRPSPSSAATTRRSSRRATSWSTAASAAPT